MMIKGDVAELVDATWVLLLVQHDISRFES